ncbi:MAG: hypothetical protein KC731_37205, partial [Myxococcales bacterium]|nr:hypothetical protein [Myxococcales bacterium]
MQFTEGLNQTLAYDYLDTDSQDFDGVVAGDLVAGPLLRTGQLARGTLSATVAVEAETDGITLTPLWQVSNDGTTWQTVYPPNGATYVAQATGTAGDDAAVERVIQAPDSVYGFKFCRVAIQVGVQTGTANDTWRISYNFKVDDAKNGY